MRKHALFQRKRISPDPIERCSHRQPKKVFDQSVQQFKHSQKGTCGIGCAKRTTDEIT